MCDERSGRTEDGGGDVQEKQEPHTEDVGKYNSNEFIRFHDNLKSDVSPNIFCGNACSYQDICLPKAKMVRVVRMNIFYRMEHDICGSKSEFWATTEH